MIASARRAGEGGARVRRRRLPAALPLIALCLPACGAPATDTAGVDVTWTLAPPAPRDGQVRLVLELAETGTPVTDARLDVHGHMTHPGMVPVVTRATEVEPGRYEAQLDLTMAGDWVLLVEGTLADGRRIRRDIPLPGVTLP